MAKAVLPEYLKKKTSEQAIWHFAKGLVHFVKYFLEKEGFLILRVESISKYL